MKVDAGWAGAYDPTLPMPVRVTITADRLVRGNLTVQGEGPAIRTPIEVAGGSRKRVIIMIPTSDSTSTIVKAQLEGSVEPTSVEVQSRGDSELVGIDGESHFDDLVAGDCGPIINPFHESRGLPLVVPVNTVTIRHIPSNGHAPIIRRHVFARGERMNRSVDLPLRAEVIGELPLNRRRRSLQLACGDVGDFGEQSDFASTELASAASVKAASMAAT